MKNERKEELKDEMKNRISLALKDPILQQGFEIICKENAELRKKKLNIRSCQNCRNYNRTCPNDGSCKNYSKWEGYKNPQLTKAKELLAKWVELFKPKNETALPTPIQVDTEQFLSDMEK